MLLVITIQNNLAIFIAIIIPIAYIGFSLASHQIGKITGYRNGLGIPIILGPNWKGKSFCINSVFMETAGINNELEYYLKAHINTYPEEKSGPQKLFPINKADYEEFEKALNQRKKGTGVFYEYIGDYRNDQCCFRRIAE